MAATGGGERGWREGCERTNTAARYRLPSRPRPRSAQPTWVSGQRNRFAAKIRLSPATTVPRQGRATIGAPGGTGVEHMCHAGLDREPRQRVRGFDEGESHVIAPTHWPRGI